MEKQVIGHGERPIEFEYLYSDGNFFVKESFTMDEIANGDPQDYFPPILKDYVVIAKRQRTGLYDKSGTKIYEGDIVEFENIGCSIKTGEVVFSNGCFEAYQKGYKKRSLNAICSVIGNKYMNTISQSE